MAKDGNYKPPKANSAPIDQEAEFWKSEEGQDIERLFNEMQSGKKTFEETRREYNEKWADKPLPNAPKQTPDAPYSSIR